MSESRKLRLTPRQKGIVFAIKEGRPIDVTETDLWRLERKGAIITRRRIYLSGENCTFTDCVEITPAGRLALSQDGRGE